MENNFDSTTINIIKELIIQFLSVKEPTDSYWDKHNMSWEEMVEFRASFKKHKKKNGFSKSVQNEILKWGGIRKFKAHDDLSIGLTELLRGKLSYKIYHKISSMSKLFSFYEPNKYFILDARVAFTLNFISKRHGLTNQYIKFNPGRSAGNKIGKALKEFDYSNGCFKNVGLGYLAFNKLVLHVFNETKPMFNNFPVKPEIVEMVLFTKAMEYLNE